MNARAQASLEMTVALAGAMVILAGSVQLCAWFANRLVERNTSYEAERVRAGTEASWSPLTEPLDTYIPPEPSARLKLFGGD